MSEKKVQKILINTECLVIFRERVFYFKSSDAATELLKTEGFSDNLDSEQTLLLSAFQRIRKQLLYAHLSVCIL